MKHIPLRTFAQLVPETAEERHELSRFLENCGIASGISIASLNLELPVTQIDEDGFLYGSLVDPSTGSRHPVKFFVVSSDFSHRAWFASRSAWFDYRGTAGPWPLTV